MSFDALDSALAPTDVQVAQAMAAGYGGWWGYIATSGWGGSAFNLLHIWTPADFDRVRVLNPKPIAFCSGLDDPVVLQSLATAWNVRLCLDDESAIRSGTGWQQAWLNASGAGIYGNCFVHNVVAPFHILSWYGVGSGDWYDTGCFRPPAPVGWQWQGSHTEFSVDVDRGTYDDWFKEEDDMFTDADRLRLGDKLWAFDLEDGDSKFLAGPDQGTYWNIISQGKVPVIGGVTTTVRVIAYQQDGTPLQAHAYTTISNQPNTRGPVQGSGQATDLGATGPGIVLGFFNDGPDLVTISIH